MKSKITKQLTIEEYELCNKLKSMRFSGMAAELEKVFSDPNADLISFNDKIQRIVDAEWDLRYTKKLNRFVKRATLKYPTADLDGTIDLTDPSLMDDQVNSLAVILYIEPVTDILTLTVNRKGLVSKTVGDHQRDQFLREMIRSIVIGTP